VNVLSVYKTTLVFGSAMK